MAPTSRCSAAVAGGEVASAGVVAAAVALGGENGTHARVSLASVAPGWQGLAAACGKAAIGAARENQRVASAAVVAAAVALGGEWKDGSTANQAAADGAGDGRAHAA